VNDIVTQLQNIVTKEELIAEPEALKLIAQQSAGGMRDAISLLDQMASTGKEITLGLTQTVLGTATSQTVIDLVDAVLNREPAAGMDAIHTALDSGTDPRILARQVVDYLRALLLLQMGNSSQVDLAADTRAQAESHARAFSSSDVLRMIKVFNIAASDLRGGWQPSLPLELALAEALEARRMPALQVAASPDKATAKEKEEKPLGKPPVQKETRETAGVTAGKAESSIMLAQVSKVWKQVKDALRAQPSLVALLNSSRLLEIKEGVLVLGFSSEVLRSKMDVPDQLELTRNAIAEVVGEDLQLRCVISNAKQPTPSNVKADGMVAAALKKGGEIVDIQE
jgi:DNA polymerase-3 subunit gamma/tau